MATSTNNTLLKNNSLNLHDVDFYRMAKVIYETLHQLKIFSSNLLFKTHF